ncbi:uncharacterized protein EI97DRAFT_438594 [Westerdykella ornata]|uniref:Uncharacterized protein n=1 Tax=Westerdykella ornata TaxID=318751 RepID=A0A6A6JYN5_WESOR|nr:uncharacterized protein EI97DRAFT_438594 [Westerdykella ornata]KAF2281203.1 hypothetical protein EI97DRAFT_438594 [Westerdykella ornata]
MQSRHGTPSAHNSKPSLQYSFVASWLQTLSTDPEALAAPPTNGSGAVIPTIRPWDRTRPRPYHVKIPIDATPEEAVRLTGMPYGVTNESNPVKRPYKITKKKQPAAKTRAGAAESPAKFVSKMPPNASHRVANRYGNPLRVPFQTSPCTPQHEILRHSPRFFLGPLGPGLESPRNQRLLLQQPVAFSQVSGIPSYMAEYFQGNQAFPMNYNQPSRAMIYQRRFSAPPSTTPMIEDPTADAVYGQAMTTYRSQSAPAMEYLSHYSIPPIDYQTMPGSIGNLLNPETSYKLNNVFTPEVKSWLGNGGIVVRTDDWFNMEAIHKTHTEVNIQDGTVRIVLTGKARAFQGRIDGLEGEKE